MPVLQDLPLWLLAGVCISFTVGFGVLGVLAARRFGLSIPEGDIGTAAALHALIGVLYAVALGLLVVRVQDAFDAVESVTDTEAIAAGDLYRSLGGLNPRARDTMRGELRSYVRLVINVEWPAFQRGEESDSTWRSIDALSRQIIQYEPVGAKEPLLYPQIAANMQTLLDARRERLFRGDNGIEHVTWIIVFVGAIVTIGGACLFPMQHKRVQLVLVGAASAMLGMMIFLVIAMDRPLRGDFSVPPSAFVRQQAIFARQQREEAVALRAP